jgi:hypothetical protein
MDEIAMTRSSSPQADRLGAHLLFVFAAVTGDERRFVCSRLRWNENSSSNRRHPLQADFTWAPIFDQSLCSPMGATG